VAISRAPVTAIVAIGANLGNAKNTVLQAFGNLNHLPGTTLKARSRLYCTAPHEAHGPDFVNAVALLTSHLTAPDLLNALFELEQLAGRERPHLNAPRTLDLDLIMYGEAHMSSPRLTLPHPRWRERAFVLYPLADLLPNIVTVDDLKRVSKQVIRVLPENDS
jgi:2-amino-4-hydroxy-6-hydroxymethyldihydropteridine diphosphokinase